MKMSEENYHAIIKSLSDRIVQAQKPLRILDSVKWERDIQELFFKKKCESLPAVNRDYYLRYPLPFDPAQKQEEFEGIERDTHKQLGPFSPLGSIILRTCREYRRVIQLLEARGTPAFFNISQELYGSADDAFYAGAPQLRDLAILISKAVDLTKHATQNDKDVKKYTSQEACQLLNERFYRHFQDNKGIPKTWVKISDGIIADAAAGAEIVKIRKDALFSERDLKILEVHEGWVHVATTINGLNQPICTFLSKGPPSATTTQEGLAIIMEILHFASSPLRVQRLTDRVTAISLAEKGADFLDVFNFFQEQGNEPIESYKNAVRIFRGSLPNAGPFTKDLVYTKGFVLIYNYLRLAIQAGLVKRIPLLFVGKTTLEDQRLIAHLVEEKLIVAPLFVPEHFTDLAGLSAWMSYSLFLNRLDLGELASDYQDILNG